MKPEGKIYVIGNGIPFNDSRDYTGERTDVFNLSMENLLFHEAVANRNGGNLKRHLQVPRDAVLLRLRLRRIWSASRWPDSAALWILFLLGRLD